MTQEGSYTLRPAKLDDVDCMVPLLAALQAHLEESNPELWRMTPEAKARLPIRVAGRLRSAESCALVAEHTRDGIVGFIFGRITANNSYTPSHTGQIDQAFVLPSHRRAGVGSLLVAELCQFFAAHGVEDLSLRYVVGNHEASSFWSSLGFSPRIVTAGSQIQTISARLGSSQTR